jgi:hypothetical protein
MGRQREVKEKLKIRPGEYAERILKGFRDGRIFVTGMDKANIILQCAKAEEKEYGYEITIQKLMTRLKIDRDRAEIILNFGRD